MLKFDFLPELPKQLVVGLWALACATAVDHLERTLQGRDPSRVEADVWTDLGAGELHPRLRATLERLLIAPRDRSGGVVPHFS